VQVFIGITSELQLVKIYQLDWPRLLNSTNSQNKSTTLTQRQLKQKRSCYSRLEARGCNADAISWIKLKISTTGKPEHAQVKTKRVCAIIADHFSAIKTTQSNDILIQPVLPTTIRTVTHRQTDRETDDVIRRYLMLCTVKQYNNKMHEWFCKQATMHSVFTTTG